MTDAAFDALYAEHRRFVLALAQRFVGVEHATDLAQLVWLKVFLRGDGFRQEAQFSSWLYRLTHNAAMDWHRRAAQRVKTEEPFSLVQHDRVAPSRSPESQAMFAEHRRALRRRLGRVPRPYRRTLMAWLVTGDVRSAARRLAVPQGTVKSRLHRAQHMLVDGLDA